MGAMHIGPVAIWLEPALAASTGYRLAGDNDADDGPARAPRFDRSTAARDDLPYKVELWDERKASVEQVLAVTASGSIGYAAYYAAAREYPDRYVTLRHGYKRFEPLC